MFGQLVVGRVYKVAVADTVVKKTPILARNVETEIARLTAAGEQVAKELAVLTEEDSGIAADILQAYILMVGDEHLIPVANQQIRDTLCCAEWALDVTVQQLVSRFDAMTDSYFRERKMDVLAVGKFVQKKLSKASETILLTEGNLGRAAQLFSDTEGTTEPGVVVVAKDISPGELVQLISHKPAGLLLDTGGSTSHVALVAQAYRIPTVVGLQTCWEQTSSQDKILFDATTGDVFIRPTADRLQNYKQKKEDTKDSVGALSSAENRSVGDFVSSKVVLPQGGRLQFFVNVGSGEEIKQAGGNIGVGLYRTEYWWAGRAVSPNSVNQLTEDEMFVFAQRALQLAGRQGVVFRTLDMGPDKFNDKFNEKSADPLLSTREGSLRLHSLGLRSLRLCFTPQVLPVFRWQLSAILRAVEDSFSTSLAKGKAKLMFPMVCDVDELRQAKHIFFDVAQQIGLSDVASQIPVGAMIEVPSAVFVAKELAAEADFLSLGTNDLTQYLLAADRGDPQVAAWYNPLHPALLRAVHAVVMAAADGNTPLTVCGQMAGTQRGALALVALGVRGLSMALPSVAAVYETITSMKSASAKGDWERLRYQLLAAQTSAEINGAIDSLFAQ